MDRPGAGRGGGGGVESLGWPGEEGGECKQGGGPGAPAHAGDVAIAAAWGPLGTSACSRVFSSQALTPVSQAQESIFPADAPTQRSVERC